MSIGRRMMAAGSLQPSDLEALEEYHQFVRDDIQDIQNASDWRSRMARKYYDQLYKEFAIIDLSRHHEGLVGLRWRTKEEVIAGKGHFSCGAKRCDALQGLQTFEVPFHYQEHGQNKLELVKVRLCRDCGEKLLHYQEISREMEQIERKREEPESPPLREEKIIGKKRKEKKDEHHKKIKKNSKEDKDHYSSKKLKQVK